MKTKSIAIGFLFGFSAMAAQGAAQAAIVSDGSFEVQGAASGTCNIANCAAGAWSGSGNSGINLDDGQNYAGATPDGHYYGFIQSVNGSTSSLYQNVTLSAGTYLISWLAGGRTNYSGPVDYTVSLGSQIFSGSLSAGQAFSATSALATLTAGTYHLAFVAHTAAGDNTALIDSVRIASVAAVPEPGTWAIMLTGLGLVGWSLRRRGAGAGLATA